MLAIVCLRGPRLAHGELRRRRWLRPAGRGERPHRLRCRHWRQWRSVPSLQSGRDVPLATPQKGAPVMRGLCVIFLIAASGSALAASDQEYTDEIDTVDVSVSDTRVSADGDENVVCPTGQMQCGTTDYCIPVGASCCDLRGSYCLAGTACDGQGHCISTAPPPPTPESDREGCNAGGDAGSLLTLLFVSAAVLMPRRRTTR